MRLISSVTQQASTCLSSILDRSSERVKEQCLYCTLQRTYHSTGDLHRWCAVQTRRAAHSQGDPTLQVFPCCKYQFQCISTKSICHVREEVALGRSSGYSCRSEPLVWATQATVLPSVIVSASCVGVNTKGSEWNMYRAIISTHQMYEAPIVK
jgi:hypothetical protein